MLSEQYFKNTTWPSVENIESMIPNGNQNKIKYQESDKIKS